MFCSDFIVASETSIKPESNCFSERLNRFLQFKSLLITDEHFNFTPRTVDSELHFSYEKEMNFPS